MTAVKATARAQAHLRGTAVAKVGAVVVQPPQLKITQAVITLA